jgi:glycosyltransferase involved in cell wall biosynthesis
MAAIKLICELSADVSLCFVGKRVDSYFDRCQQATLDYGLSGRVKFLQDDECDLGLEIASSLLVFLPSVTEALPTVLIEAMACGTPFVATPVGAVPNLKGGITAHSLKSQLEAVNLLKADDHLWSAYSDAGIKQYQEEFSEVCIKDQLITAVHSAINNHLNRAKNRS